MARKVCSSGKQCAGPAVWAHTWQHVTKPQQRHDRVESWDQKPHWYINEAIDNSIVDEEVTGLGQRSPQHFCHTACVPPNMNPPQSCAVASAAVPSKTLIIFRKASLVIVPNQSHPLCCPRLLPGPTLCITGVDLVERLRLASKIHTNKLPFRDKGLGPGFGYTFCSKYFAGAKSSHVMKATPCNALLMIRKRWGWGRTKLTEDASQDCKH